ncbi:MAG: hypothetical protein ACRDCF_02220 [Mycoplasmoidaceae bacterium]
MKYKIINHDTISETIDFIGNEILEELKTAENVSCILPWYPNLDFVYRCLFNYNTLSSKWAKKNISKKIRKKLPKEFNKIKIINMYDFIGPDNIEFFQVSTYQKFFEILDSQIQFCSFRLKDEPRINKELLISPSDFDKTIKVFTNGRISFSTVFIDKDGNIPYIENYVENIGTNLSAIDEKEAENLMEIFKLNNAPEQSINCGNRSLTKSHKIIAIIEKEALKYLTNEQYEKNPSASMKTLRNHDNVLYIVKSWENE